MNYNDEIYAKTKKYQKIYGFDIGTGSHDTWNNEADAFKHAFGSADMALRANVGVSKIIGDLHEYDGRKNMNQPKEEENMDKWNNSEGRKIAQKLAKQIGSEQLIKQYAFSGKLDDMIAEEVMEKMRKGDLITNPFKDKRSYQKKVDGSTTGYATNISDGKIFTAEEIGNMTSDEFSNNEKFIMKQLKEMGVPREYEAKEAVQNGTMIWVNSYTRDDGGFLVGRSRAQASEPVRCRSDVTPPTARIIQEGHR